MDELLDLEAALELVLGQAQALESEDVALAEARGRVLAGPARAVVDLPPFPSSAMDGFALRAADTPGTLAVVAEIAAGQAPTRAVESGQAIAIATGASVPDGADAVIPIEYVVHSDNEIEISDSVDAGANVRPRGRDARAGELVLDAGAELGAAQLGALAAAGVVEVAAARKPQAAVLTTGSELRSPGEVLAPGQIYDANGVILAAQLESAGADVTLVQRVPDDEASHREALEAALAADVLVSSGGVSVGPHDLVRAVGASLGIEEVFWRVAVKPGKPVWFGTRDRTLVFGLPGNPVSSLVAFELFVRPALRQLQGSAEPGPRYLTGTAGSALRRDAARDQLLRARRRGDELDPIAGQESHMIVRAALADVLVHVPRGEGEIEAGARVRYLLL